MNGIGASANGLINKYSKNTKAESVDKNKTSAPASKTSDTQIANKQKEDYKVNISDLSKELKKELDEAAPKKPISGTEAARKIHNKKFGTIQKPGVFFVSGFDWFGAGSVKGNYDGIQDMADAIDGAEHFAWDNQSDIIEEIKKRSPDQPIVLVGHSFGGDSVVEIAEELNTIENGFRTIDLLVTLDSVGFDNDIIPQNVKKNINFLAQGPYDFLNDGPNIARNYNRTEVDNYLRPELHADLDDATDIQIEVLEAIKNIV